MTILNGINTADLGKFAETVSSDPSSAKAKFTVKTNWKGGTKTESSISSYELFGKSINRNFKISADEPFEIFGENTAPNPQELLLSALNACMSVGYAAAAAMNGVTIKSMEIETKGELDLRGFLGMDNINPGYDTVEYTIRVDADAPLEKLRTIHQAMMNTSPNFANFAKAINVQPKLELFNN